MSEPHGPFGSPALLPAPWADAPYLLSNHGDSLIHRAWTRPRALLALTQGTGRRLGLLGLGDAEVVAAMLESAEVRETIDSLDQLVAGPSDDATRLVPELLTGTESALDHTPDGAGMRGERSVVQWLTVPRGTLEHTQELSERLGHLGGRGEWDWMWTGAPLRDADATGVERVAATPDARAEIEEFLARAHPLSDTAVTDPRLFAWWTLRTGGALSAVVGGMRFAPGLPPYLVSLGVDPALRGRGLAGAVLAAAVRDGLAESPRLGRGVSLALYADNDRARRVYLRLGFELQHQFESLRAQSPDTA